MPPQSDRPTPAPGGDRDSPSEIPKSADPWQTVFEETEPGLRAFLGHRLRQPCDVDDCIQAVFVTMVSKGNDVPPAARRAWLFRVAANQCARFWRDESATRKAVHGSAGLDQNDTPVDPAVQFLQDETKQNLRTAVGLLSREYQEVLRLRLEDDLSFREIAQRLNIPLGTALTRMRRALEKLKKDFQSSD